MPHRQIGAGGWLEVERRLADYGGETLQCLVTDEAMEAHPKRRRRDTDSPGVPESSLLGRRRNQGALREASTSDCTGEA